MKRMQLPLLFFFGLGLTGCEIPEFLKFDLNSLIEQHCGEYRFDGQTAPERCGRIWGAHGFMYQKDGIFSGTLGADTSSSDLIPTAWFWFDNRYLRLGQKIGPGQALVSCSRYKPNDPTRYTTVSREFAFEVLKKGPERKVKEIVQSAEWTIKWRIECPLLQMSLTGEDVVEIDYGPIPSDWKKVGRPSPPPFAEDTGSSP